MPTPYSWTVAGASSGGSSGTSSAGVGTGTDGRRAYAVTRKMDPMTGDVIFDDTRRSWAEGAPVMERVLRCLRTERGTAMRDPAYGVDWSPVDNARTGAAVAAKQAIRDALKRYIDAGELANLTVEVDSIKAASGRALLFKLTFADVRGVTFAVTVLPTSCAR